MRACLVVVGRRSPAERRIAMLVAMPSAKAILQSLIATGALTAIESGKLVDDRAWPEIGDQFLVVASMTILSGWASGRTRWSTPCS